MLFTRVPMRVKSISNHFACLLIAALPGTAMGQMTYLSSSRVVRAETGGGIETFSFTSPGEWNSQAASSNIGNAGATATQVGNLRPDGITFESHTAAWNINGFPSTCSSDLDTTFTITSPTPYEIVGGPNSGSASMVRLSLGTTTIFNFSTQALQGTLQPGIYRFQVELQSTAVTGIPDNVMNQNTNFTLNIPAPGAVGAFALVGVATTTRRRRS